MPHKIRLARLDRVLLSTTAHAKMMNGSKMSKFDALYGHGVREESSPYLYMNAFFSLPRPKLTNMRCSERGTVFETVSSRLPGVRTVISGALSSGY